MDKLKHEIQQRAPFRSRHEEAFLNLQRTANVLMQDFSQSLKRHGLTPTQYNALRILRGAHPEPLPCGEVGLRMVTPVPDVTRLLNRLAARQLLERSRDDRDRRVVRVQITEEGLDLLAGLDEPVDVKLRQLLDNLQAGQLEQLIQLLEIARTP